MLIPYDYLMSVMEQNHYRDWNVDRQLKYFANDIMDMLGIESRDEIASSLRRTFQACETLKFSLDENFKRIYRFNGENLIVDWKISSLACYLIIINCNPIHESVARTQLYFAVRRDLYS